MKEDRLITGLRITTLLIAVLLISACAQEKALDLAASPARAGESEGMEEPAAPQTRMLIHTVRLRIVVPDTEAVSQAVTGEVEAIGGYVSNLNAYRYDDDLMRVSLELRVPTDRLDETVTAIKARALKVEAESRTTEDVTAQVVDLDARRRTLRATETELQRLLEESKSRQQKAEDVMAIYRQLTEIRGRIEQIESHLKTFQGQVELATIHLDLIPDEAYSPVLGDRWRPQIAARGSVRALFSALRWLANFAIFTIICLLPIGSILYGFWRLLRGAWRRLRSGRARPNPGVQPGTGGAGSNEEDGQP